MYFCTEKSRLTGAVVQLVRIQACHAWGRGFESRPYRKTSDFTICKIGCFFYHYPISFIHCVFFLLIATCFSKIIIHAKNTPITFKPFFPNTHLSFLTSFIRLTIYLSSDCISISFSQASKRSEFSAPSSLKHLHNSKKGCIFAPLLRNQG